MAGNELKILTVCERLFPDTSGGPSLSIYLHNKHLTTNNLRVTTVTSAKGIHKELRDSWISNEQGSVYYCSQLVHKVPISLIVRAIRQVKHHNIIHVHSFFYLSSITLALYGWFRNKKIIWSIHGELDDACLKLKWLKKITFLTAIKRIVPKIATLHVTSDQEKYYVLKRLPTVKIINLPAFIEVPNLVGVSARDKYFLYVGRFHPKKGLEMLIEAMSLSMLFRNSNLCLKIAGDYHHAYGAQIIKLIKKHSLDHKIQLLGKVTEEEKVKLFARAYFTIMPSLTENFGFVAAESLSFGTPVITTKGTPWEYLNTYKCGFWIDYDAQILANHIDASITLNGQTYNDYRKQAKRLILDKFDISKQIGEWITQYRQFIS